MQTLNYRYQKLIDLKAFKCTIENVETLNIIIQTIQILHKTFHSIAIQLPQINPGKNHIESKQIPSKNQANYNSSKNVFPDKFQSKLPTTISIVSIFFHFSFGFRWASQPGDGDLTKYL